MSYRFEEVNYALARNLGRPRTVLDVGCGIGLNGAAAKATGAYVVGIDMDPCAGESASKLLDEFHAVDIQLDAIPDALRGRTFDLILFGDVLEHTVSPLAVLCRFCELLSDGGHVIISLPNIAAWTIRYQLLCGQFRYQESGILDKTHLRFFTRDTTIELAEQAGLQVLRLDLNPMIARVAKDLLLQSHNQQDSGVHDPTALTRTPLYRAYRQWVRPLEGCLAKALPNLLAFQHVIVARKPLRVGPLSLTVGMLTRDKEQCVEQMIDGIRTLVPDAKILLVDSSSDKTPQLAASRGVRVVRQRPAAGHGPAMKQLMYEAASESESLIYLDCDCTYPLALIPRIRELLEQGADVVNTSRNSIHQPAMPLANFLANRFFALTARTIHGIPTCDLHSGMRGYRTSVIRGFNFSGKGDALSVGTLLLPSRSGYHVVEIPISYNPRVGNSKLAMLRGTFWTFARIATALNTGRRVNSGCYQQLASAKF